MSNTILVTGSTGFVGRGLLEKLQVDGYRVRGVIHKKKNVFRKNEI